MKRAILTVAAIYAILGILALLMVPASLHEWFGIEKDPLSGIFALMFGLPWTLALNLFEDTTTYFSLCVAALGIALNTWILTWIARTCCKP